MFWTCLAISGRNWKLILHQFYEHAAKLKVENLAQTTFRLSPVSFHAPLRYVTEAMITLGIETEWRR